MINVLFVFFTGIFIALYLRWGFTRLTRENMQILAAMPGEKHPEGFWNGVNFTWYGLLSANALLFGAGLYVVLAGSRGVSAFHSLILMVFLISVLLPAARIIARIVEKKNHTFTVGGSVFAGVVIAPFLIGALNLMLGWVSDVSYPMIETLSALSIAYAFGESLGRLACISFGCCYGKPLSDVHPLIQNLFRNHHFVFTGHTRKACYASRLDGVKTVPIQGVTATIYAVAAWIGMILFMAGYPGAALLVTLLTTQIWRVMSEFLRADYRGGGFLSAYQVMGLAASVFAVIMVILFPEGGTLAMDIGKGMHAVWNPWVLVFLQVLWAVTFVYMGKSTVTYSHLRFHVDESRI